MNYEVLSNSVWTYPDSLVKSDGAKEIRLASPRNATASCQILFNDLPLGAAIKFDNAVLTTVSRGLPVFVAKNSGSGTEFFEDDWTIAQTYTTRQAPFEVLDALEPLPDKTDTIQSATEMFYLAFEIPQDAPVGCQHSAVEVTIGDCTLNIPLELEIFAAAVPEHENLQISNWYWINEMAEQYQVEKWSDAHFAVLAKYAALMRRTRQTHFWIPKEAVIASQTADGYHFDFTRVKRIIEIFLQFGFSKIEGPLLAYRENFGDDHFMVDAAGSPVNAVSEAGREYLAQYISAWREFLSQNNWLALLQQHVADEPTDACAKDFQELVKLIRQYMPGVPLMEAVDTTDFGDNAPDILIPTNWTYQHEKQAFEAFRAQGHTLWYYTCCFPNGHWLNRFLDMPLIRPRLLHWANIKYDLTGYLHWGLNAGEGVNPYHQEEPYFPCGDMTMTYPGKDGPLASMRLEAMRQGLQDFELLYQLPTNPAKAIVSQLISSFDQVDEDPIKLEALRQLILVELSK